MENSERVSVPVKSDLPPLESSDDEAPAAAPPKEPSALCWATPLCDAGVVLACTYKQATKHKKTEGRPVLMCRRCGARYCSQRCQKRDWDTRHRLLCPLLNPRSPHGDEALLASLVARTDAPAGVSYRRLAIVAYGTVMLAARLVATRAVFNMDHLVAQVFEKGVVPADVDDVSGAAGNFGPTSSGDYVASYAAVALAHLFTGSCDGTSGRQLLLHTETSAQLVVALSFSLVHMLRNQSRDKESVMAEAYQMLMIDSSLPVAPLRECVKVAGGEACSPRNLWLTAAERQQWNTALLVYFVPTTGGCAHSVLVWAHKDYATIVQTVANVYGIGAWLERHVPRREDAQQQLPMDLASPWAAERIPRAQVLSVLFGDIETLVAAPGTPRYDDRRAAFRRIAALRAETPLPGRMSKEFPERFQVFTIPLYLNN